MLQSFIKSKRKDDELASLLRLEGGKIIKESKTATPVGTNISVRNLFFNTPKLKSKVWIWV